MRWLKRLGYAAAALVALVLLAVGTAYTASEVQFRKVRAIPKEPALALAATPDSATVARGSHLAVAIAKCVDCHGEGFRGTVFIDDPVLGRLVAPNLTRGAGGIGDSLTAEVIEHAVRHGVGTNGRSLRIMPSVDYTWMSDADMVALASYIRALPPADHVLPPTNVKLLPRVLMIAGKMPLLSYEEAVQGGGKPMALEPAPTKEYGEYVARVGGCTGCHGPNLSGGPIAAGPPDWPPAANLTPSGNLGKWTEAEFVQTLKTGVRPNGIPLNPVMPWKLAGKMDSTEFHALWLYLKSVPPRTAGTH